MKHPHAIPAPVVDGPGKFREPQHRRDGPHVLDDLFVRPGLRSCPSTRKSDGT